MAPGPAHAAASDLPDVPIVMVVVPIRSFRDGKARLATRLDDRARAALVRNLADRVYDAVAGLPVVVVSNDPDVVAWARGRGASVVDDPGSLDAAAEAGREHARTRGAERVVVIHADLPRIRSITPVLAAGGVVVVPDRFDDGTPVIALPTEGAFSFAFGPGSFRRHCAEALARGYPLEIVRRDDLAFDIDRPEDLDDLARLDAR
jgi:2-phospho-L-lactate guanylyltransferase